MRIVTDIHSHVLPGVDDGSPDFETSLDMLRTAVKSGCQHLVCTPHANHPKRSKNLPIKDLQQTFQQLCRAIEVDRLPIDLSLGMEVLVTPACLETFTEHFLPLNGSRYYLIEFSFEETKGRILDAVRQIIKKRVVPVVAHPERYTSVQVDPGIVYEIYRIGGLTQINQGSVLGHFGSKAQDTACLLLNFGLTSAVASDAHDDVIRRCDMQKCESFIQRNYGSTIMRKLMVENPNNIIRNRLVDFGGYQPLPPRK